jgi:hypothetical protein
MDWVHASVDRPGMISPPWTNDGVDRGGAGAWRRGALTKAQPSAAPVHQSSLAGAQQREECTESLARASPGLRRRCGGRATAVQNRRRRRSVRGRLEHGEK